ncbi:hypothetical protein [Desulfovibrio sp. 86]|uniref:hypothetical protein n=1 Tax=Desulfovibrio sp. 86 TaxID=2666132 RepID=UPI0015D15862|nr:hypothetical protein [Desulfovibrio sp. 86]
MIQTDGDSSLMGGLDHLNGLDASAQEKATAADSGIQFDSALAAGHGPADHGSGSADPELPPAAEVAFVRAVLYSPGDPGDSVSTPVFFGRNGVAPLAVPPNDIDFGGSAPDARYAVTVFVPEGWSASWVDINVDSSTGRLKFSLTPDGAAELQRLGLTNKNLVDLVHVKVADRVSGGTFEYNVELVGTSTQNFDSIEYDRQSVEHNAENIGEFHQGQHNSGVYSIISSSRNDEIILNDNVAGGSSIYASGSVDRAHMADDTNTITLNAGVVNSTLGSSTQIISANGALQVAGTVAVEGNIGEDLGAENVIAMGKGSVYVHNPSGDGVSTTYYGKNDISGGAVDITSTSGSGLSASTEGANNIASSGDVTIASTNRSESSQVESNGIYSDGYGNNSIKADSGDVTVTAAAAGSTKVYSYGINAAFKCTNSINADSGDVTVTAAATGTSDVYSDGIFSGNFGSTSITTKSGDVTVTGNATATSDTHSKGTGVTTEAGASNIITTDSGSVTVAGKGSVIGAGMDCSGGGSTSTITTGSGAVTVSGAGTTVGYGMYITDGHNTITTNSGEVKVSGSGADSGHGMSAEFRGINTIESTAGSPLTVTITASADTAEKAVAMWARGEYVGGVNRIIGHSQANGTDRVTLTANDGQGIAMLADYGGKNIITTGAGDDSVTINGAVKSIFPLVGSDPANEIDLGGGKNTLTLNGAVEAGSLKVSSEAGTYTLELQAPDAESFVARYGDWITAIGADPLIADGLRGISFVGLNPADLPADFMTTFEGVLEAIYTRAGADAIVPPELIHLLPGHDSDSGFAVSFAETDAEHQTQDAQHAAAGHDISTQDVQHAAAQHAAVGYDASTQDVQHAAAGYDISTQDAQNATTGHDASTQDVQHAAAGYGASTQETPSAAHEGSVHMAGDDSQVAAAAASVQPDTAALHADILVPDDIAQPDVAVVQHVVETAQPLFAFLNAPGAGAHVDTSAYEGDAPLHNGHLGSGESQSGNAGVQGEIVLTLGDESLDSLFAGTDQQLADNGEHGLWYVESGSDLHEVALTDMSEIIVQGGPGEHVSDAGVTTEEYAHLEQEVVSAPTVMDPNQETTDNAAREMTTY